MREWVAFHAMEPWGGLADYHRTGIVAAILANQHRDPRRGKMATPADFMPRQPAPAAPAGGVSSAQLRARLATVFGGRIRRADDGDQD